MNAHTTQIIVDRQALVAVRRSRIPAIDFSDDYANKVIQGLQESAVQVDFWAVAVGQDGRKPRVH